jgi:hypothetical protein
MQIGNFTLYPCVELVHTFLRTLLFPESVSLAGSERLCADLRMCTKIGPNLVLHLLDQKVFWGLNLRAPNSGTAFQWRLLPKARLVERYRDLRGPRRLTRLILIANARCNRNRRSAKENGRPTIPERTA